MRDCSDLAAQIFVEFLIFFHMFDSLSVWIRVVFLVGPNDSKLDGLEAISTDVSKDGRGEGFAADGAHVVAVFEANAGQGSL